MITTVYGMGFTPLVPQITQLVCYDHLIFYSVHIHNGDFIIQDITLENQVNTMVCWWYMIIAKD